MNTAANGRSSKSFIDEGRWAEALAKRGRYYLIQFGHNDEPGKGPERETDPATTYRANMTRYVDDVARHRRDADSRDLARPAGSTKKTERFERRRRHTSRSSGRWRRRRTCRSIDLHAISLADAESAGDDVWADLSPRDEKGQVDRTHLNAKGSDVVGKMVVDALRTAVPELAPLLIPPGK